MKTPHLEMYCEIAIGTGLEIDADYLLSRLKATPLGDAWARPWEGTTGRLGGCLGDAWAEYGVEFLDLDTPRIQANVQGERR